MEEESKEEEVEEEGFLKDFPLDFKGILHWISTGFPFRILNDFPLDF